VLELRLPWSYLTFGDPSSHTVYVPHRDGTVTGEHVGRLGIVAARGRQVLQTPGYDWEDWNRVTWHERRKQGWDVLHRAFAGAATAVRSTRRP
jgi:hypothetical protein